MITAAAPIRSALGVGLLCALISAAGLLLAAPARAATPMVTEFTADISGGAFPNGITAGPDGNLWFTENGEDRVGRITPTGSVTEFGEFEIGDGADPVGIATGRDGNLYFAGPGADLIGQMTTLGAYTALGTTGVGATPMGIAAGSDGNLWYAGRFGNLIGRMTTAGAVMEFTAGISMDAGPWDIAAGPDGNLWFTEYDGNRIGRISTSGAVDEFALPTAAALPTGITAGPDGNLWFTEQFGNKIGRITPSGTITEFSAGISAGAQPTDIVAGQDGNLWFTEGADRIGRITPTGVVTEFSTGSTAQPIDIAGGPDGNLWFTEILDAIGRINTALDPPAFQNVAPLAVPDNATAVPYPSNLSVSGLEGTVTNVSVRITGISHGFGSDLDALLVGPQGQKVLLSSDVGSSVAATGVTLNVTDSAPFSLGTSSPLVSGVFEPTDFGPGETFPGPAPGPPYGTALSAFNGTNPNGIWKLFVQDDRAGESGRISGGWGLDIQTTGPPPSGGGPPPAPAPTAPVAPAVTTPNPQCAALRAQLKRAKSKRKKAKIRKKLRALGC